MTQMRTYPTEHYTRISPAEKSHNHPDCGCRLEWTDNGGVALYHCPTHAAAPEMRDLVERMAFVDCDEGDHPVRPYAPSPDTCDSCAARALLARVGG